MLMTEISVSVAKFWKNPTILKALYYKSWNWRIRF